jgi:hypothetical protein
MAFYPMPFGHVEIHVDRLDPRPEQHHLAEALLLRRKWWKR